MPTTYRPWTLWDEFDGDINDAKFPVLNPQAASDNDKNQVLPLAGLKQAVDPFMVPASAAAAANAAIQDKLDEAAATGGRVVLEPSATPYVISGATGVRIPVGVEFDCNWQRTAWTYNTANADAYAIMASYGSTLQNFLMDYTAGTAGTGSPIKLDAASFVGPSGALREAPTTIRAGAVFGPDGVGCPGVGVLLKADGTSEDQYVQFVIVDDVMLSWFQDGVRLEGVGTGANLAFVNANNIINNTFHACRNNVMLKGTTGAAVAGNVVATSHFQTFQNVPNGWTPQTVVRFDRARENQVLGCVLWDWANNGGPDEGVTFDTGSYGNDVVLRAGGTVNHALFFGGAGADNNQFRIAGRDYAGTQVQAVTGGTIDARFGKYFRITAVASTLVDIVNGWKGREIVVHFGGNDTTVDFTGTNLKGNGGVDWNPTSDDWMRCWYDGSVWRCEVHEG